MHKIYRSLIVFMCIFALTHHLPTISASASDLSSSTISSSSLYSTSTLPASSVTSSSAGKMAAGIATAKASDALTKATDLFAIENDVAAKEVSIGASLSSSSAAAAKWSQSVLLASSSSKSLLLQPLEHSKKLATHRQTRSLFYSYPYINLYIGYGGVSCQYAFRRTFHKFCSAYDPYYGYPCVIYG